jgi:ABC-2 type transport system permease protein
MNIFFHELKANLKSLIIWVVIVALFNVLGFSKASAYYNNPEMLAVLNSMPPAMLDAFNMNAFNLTTMTGFFGIMVVYFGLILSIAAAMWGSGIISKEERDKTVEFALTLPVTRSRVVLAKLAAMVVNCIILLGVNWVVTLAVASQYEAEPGFTRFVADGMLSFFILQMIFLALGVFLGCALKKHKLAGSISVWVLLGTYFLSILVSMNKDLDALKYLTPFKYFDGADLLRNPGMEPGYILLSVGIIALLITGAFLTYRRRDLYI